MSPDRALPASGRTPARVVLGGVAGMRFDDQPHAAEGGASGTRRAAPTGEPISRSASDKVTGRCG
jgi:hypothetical protein